jgi:hypothetical protein
MKLTPIALACALALSAPAAFAQSANDEAIKSDVTAVDKDNAALEKDRARLAQHRADKAQDKATDAYGSQAVDSVKIGADHTMIGEKKAERGVDKKILHNDKADADTDHGDPQTSTARDTQ